MYSDGEGTQGVCAERGMGPPIMGRDGFGMTGPVSNLDRVGPLGEEEGESSAGGGPGGERGEEMASGLLAWIGEGSRSSGCGWSLGVWLRLCDA